METSAFIEALTETLIISTAQAFAIVLFFRVMFSAVPEIPSAIKYRLWYSSLILIFGLFIYTLSSMYGQKIHQDTISGTVPILQQENHRVSWLTTLESWKLKYAGFIASFYFAGVGIQFLSLTFAWFRARSLGQAEPLLHDPVWMMKLDTLCEKLQIAKKISLHISERITVPVTAGFIKPVILLPVAMVSRLSPEQVESILLHELAHIKRNDYIWNIGQKVIESILFFNPFVWLIAREIHKEREYCCDEIVVSKTSDPMTYAKALLQLEVQVKCNELTMAASGMDKYPLLERIKRISGLKNPDPAPRTGLIVLATILCIGLSLAVALPQHEGVKMDLDAKQNASKSRVSTEVKSQEISTVVDSPDEGRPVLSRFIVKAPLRKDTVSGEPAEIKLHKEAIHIHAAEVRKIALEQAKHQEMIKKHAEEIRKHFESKEWKEMQKELVEHSVAMSKAAVAAAKISEVPPVPPVEAEVPAYPDKLNRKLEKLQRKLESAEWQEKQMELHRKISEFTRKVTSVDWNKKGHEIEKQVEALVEGFDPSSTIKY